MPLQLVRNWLGHANVSQMSTYLAANNEWVEADMDASLRGARGIPKADCITTRNDGAQTAATGFDAGRQTTENADGMRTDVDSDQLFYYGVPGSIPGGAISCPCS